ncbi:RNA-binding cell elongation regulator Jag/EloR [Parasphaerochaeta coccoides]|uniref:RNA-binding protein KhpB n=1 Tax=Parasphaerochaeta coccoides (strain ATCC BAA-1237 / DSM 17374 / SPN1) TaxID=760011 RepID=F4GI91_PARC1|nr:RNA-binding cell elongation regulator Jag/EloR [Parasphaerochaeta coccoides]AEC01250.1 single-stranded nucleic acid binding R3H domain-containing protein [Parasphaerochaeta coccoides DSM 17374]
MVREFEGRTEQEAIDKAIDELHIEREDFDVEIIENTRKSLFKKGMVRIRVHIGDDEPMADEDFPSYDNDAPRRSRGRQQKFVAEDDAERAVVEFIAGILERMGYPGEVSIASRKDAKLGLNIESEHSSIIIGRKGKNLDALQMMANVFIGKFDSDRKVVIDSEDYRMRHEEQLIRVAFRTAEQVKNSGRSRLLEPMNPFERRLVHTALGDMEGIETKSEGEGLYKQIRITFHGMR